MPGVCMLQTQLTYRGGGSPVVWPGDILPGAFRDHGLNSEGVSGLHHPMVLFSEGSIGGGGLPV